MKNEMINLLIDLDGVVFHESTNFPALGKLREGAKEYLKLLYEDPSFTLTLHTCRSEDALDIALKFLEENDIKFHYYNEHPQHILEKYGKTKENASRKLSGIFVDNQSIEHAVNGLENMISWERIYELCKRLKS